MQYVIRCLQPCPISGEELFWSNDEGWTESDNFEVFTASELTLFNLPMEGEWVELKTS
jgi:hypothetical protein